MKTRFSRAFGTTVAFGVVALIFTVACSGSGGDSPGLATGGSSGTAGDSGTDGALGCDGSADFLCAPGCGGDVIFGASCVAGTWTCPDNMVRSTDCPDDTCFSYTPDCCAPDGSVVSMRCPGQGWPICPPGTTPAPSGYGSCPYPPGCEANGCGPTEACTFENDHCGSGSPGTCTAKPATCPSDGPPACGCDGVVYANDCLARQAGVDMGTGCAPLSGMQLCGTRYCKLGAEYCRITMPAQASLKNLAECVPLPASCAGNISCACLAQEPCADQCSEGVGMPKLSCAPGK